MQIRTSGVIFRSDIEIKKYMVKYIFTIQIEGRAPLSRIFLQQNFRSIIIQGFYNTKKLRSYKMCLRNMKKKIQKF